MRKKLNKETLMEFFAFSVLLNVISQKNRNFANHITTTQRIK